MFTINLEDGREAPSKASWQNLPIKWGKIRTKVFSSKLIESDFIIIETLID